jgi:DNA-binding IscR family transcriptional regulator
VACVSATHFEPCSQEGKCRFRRVLLDIRNYVAELMDGATLAKVFAGAVVTKEEIFNIALTDGAGI